MRRSWKPNGSGHLVPNCFSECYWAILRVKGGLLSIIPILCMPFMEMRQKSQNHSNISGKPVLFTPPLTSLTCLFSSSHINSFYVLTNTFSKVFLVWVTQLELSSSYFTLTHIGKGKLVLRVIRRATLLPLPNSPTWDLPGHENFNTMDTDLETKVVSDSRFAVMCSIITGKLAFQSHLPHWLLWSITANRVLVLLLVVGDDFFTTGFYFAALAGWCSLCSSLR